MKYYKILNNTEFIGVVSSANFVAENPISKWVASSDENHGQFVEYKEDLYHDYWMQPVVNSDREFIIAKIVEITQEEYEDLREAIDNNEPIIIDDDDEEQQPVIIPLEPDITIEFAREAKINEMSRACRQTIESGFDLELRGETHHFSLTTQDQLNLMSLSVLAQTQTLIPYHADGEECTFYTSDEINTLVQKMNELKIYNTAYYNALKEYINSLETIEEIGAITYGTPIPDQYKSDVLQVLE